VKENWSQLPRNLGQEISSTVHTVGSRVESYWRHGCLFLVHVVMCYRTEHIVHESYQTVYMVHSSRFILTGKRPEALTRKKKKKKKRRERKIMNI
jgi:hypothetical protein